jgi:DNA-binding MarR family transcriptional regulator
VTVRDTSLQAWQELLDSGRITRQQHKILLAINFARARDFSLQEVVRLAGLPINVVSARVNELKARGLLAEGLRRACRVTGRRVIPVRLTVAGLAAQGELFMLEV